MRVAIVGGGIAGLAAARRLESIAPEAEVVLLEREARLGGKIQTERTGGYVIEAAPDSFLARKPRGVGLCEELGLSDDLVGRQPENHRSFVRRGDELHRLPEGLTGLVPTSLGTLAETRLLSAEGLRRFGAEPTIPVADGDEDESVGSFVSRRFGREAYEALVEPLVTGIYGGDGDRLSLAATFPQLREVEREHGSLLRGLAEARPPEGQAFLSLRPGMGELVTALAASLARTELVVDCEVTRVRRGRPGFELQLAGGETLAADGLVLAAPAHVTAELMADLDPVLAELHAEIPYVSPVVVTLAFAATDARGLDGYGYVVPRGEGTDVLACTWSSAKWGSRAPENAALVRVYAGRSGGRDLTVETDDTLITLALDELRHAGVDAEPTLTRVHRWPLAMPQYVLGHPERLERIEDAAARHPGLALAGAAYRGVGIPDCIASGEAAAESVTRSLAHVPV